MGNGIPPLWRTEQVGWSCADKIDIASLNIEKRSILCREERKKSCDKAKRCAEHYYHQGDPAVLYGQCRKILLQQYRCVRELPP